MPYPDSQNGRPLPKFSGWRPIDWYSEPMMGEDRWIWIGVGDVPFGSSCPENRPDHPANYAIGITSANPPVKFFQEQDYSKSWALYRKVEEEFPGWVQLKDSEILKEGDIIISEKGNPEDSRKKRNPHALNGTTRTHVYCEKLGFGGGLHTLEKIRKTSDPLAHRVFRQSVFKVAMKQARRISNYQPQPLPLP